MAAVIHKVSAISTSTLTSDGVDIARGNTVPSPPPFPGISAEENIALEGSLDVLASNVAAIEDATEWKVMEVATTGVDDAPSVVPGGESGVVKQATSQLDNLMAEAAAVLTSFNTDKKFLWQRRQFYNILVVKGAANSPSTDGAVLTAVGRLSDTISKLGNSS